MGEPPVSEGEVIADVTARIAATDRINLEDARLLESVGVPIFDLLAAELEIPVDDVTELITSGQVDYSTFEAALARAE